jgi:Mg-chelatase subunit ChlD
MSNKQSTREKKFNKAMAAITDPDQRMAYLQLHPELLPEVDASLRFQIHGEIAEARDEQGNAILIKMDASQYMVTGRRIDPATGQVMPGKSLILQSAQLRSEKE